MAEPSTATAVPTKRRRASQRRSPAWPPLGGADAMPWPPFWDEANGRLKHPTAIVETALLRLAEEKPSWASAYATQALAALGPQSAKALLPALSASIFAGRPAGETLSSLADRLALSRLSETERNRRLAQAIHHARGHTLLQPIAAPASAPAAPAALANVALAASLHELERAAAQAVQIELSLRPMVLDGRFARFAETLTKAAPDQGADLTKALGHVRALLQAIRNISCARHMLADGKAGDIVAYDAGRHRLVHTPFAGQAITQAITLVRLIDPVVLALRPDGQKIVVCQAAVEPVTDADMLHHA